VCDTLEDVESAATMPPGLELSWVPASGMMARSAPVIAATMSRDGCTIGLSVSPEITSVAS